MDEEEDPRDSDRPDPIRIPFCLHLVSFHLSETVAFMSTAVGASAGTQERPKINDCACSTGR